MDGLTDNWPALLLVYSAFALAVGSPGPSNMAIIATSMNEGRSSGLTLAAGVTAGSLTWGILAAVGISALLAAYAPALLAIKIAGGFYLLYLAYRSARSALSRHEPAAAARPYVEVTHRRTFGRGYLMHLTNPKAILNWTAIMALGLSPDVPTSAIIAMLAGCFAISLGFNCIYALIFSTEAMARGYRRMRRGIEGLFALFFVAAGLKLMLSR